MKIRIYPTHKQKNKMKEWMHSSRAVYNEAVALVNSGAVKPYFNALRDMLVSQTSDHFERKKKEHLSKTPKTIRAETVREVATAFKIGFSQNNRFKVKFRSRKVKKGYYPLVFEEKAFSKSKKKQPSSTHIHMFGDSIGALRYRIGKKQKLLPPLTKTSKITYTEPGIWHLLVPCEKYVVKTTPRYSKIGLDPGERAFQTGYSPDGLVLEIKHDSEKVDKMFGMIASLQSAIDRKMFKQRTRQHLKRKIHKMWWRWKNMRDDLHRKVIRILVDNFETIVVGKLGVKNIMQSNLNKKSKKHMCPFYLILLHFVRD